MLDGVELAAVKFAVCTEVLPCVDVVSVSIVTLLAVQNLYSNTPFPFHSQFPKISQPLVVSLAQKQKAKSQTQNPQFSLNSALISHD